MNEEGPGNSRAFLNALRQGRAVCALCRSSFSRSILSSAALPECYLFMGELDKAEDYYCKAMAGNSSAAVPYMRLATVAVQRSELDKALILIVAFNCLVREVYQVNCVEDVLPYLEKAFEFAYELKKFDFPLFFE